MATFMDVPLEVRNMIYEYCLVKNSTLVPFEEFNPLEPQDLAFRKDLPTVALLQVNKTIEAEAAAILYGKNTWRVTVHITHISPVLCPSTGELLGPIMFLWKKRGPLFRNVIIVFDQRDTRLSDVKNGTLLTNYFGPLRTSEERRNRMHDLVKGSVRLWWGVKFDHVCHMTNIRSLTFEVSLAFCHFGCCRTEAMQWILDVFRSRYYQGDDHTYLQQLLDQGLRITVEGFWKRSETEIFEGLEFPVNFVKLERFPYDR